MKGDTCPIVFQSMLLELFCRFPRQRKLYTDGSKEDNRTAKQFYYIPYTDFKYNISVYLDDILQSEWNINVTNTLFEVQPTIKRFFTPMERRRDDIVSCKVRICHAYFPNGYLLRGELQPMCCNNRLTVRHVFLSCARYAHIRRKYFSFNSLFELFRDTPAGFIISSNGNVTSIICFNYHTLKLLSQVF